MENQFNAYKIILEKLERHRDADYENNSTCMMFIHLIKMLGEEDFNINFIQGADYHKDYDSFYYGYHKQFRQADMYLLDGAEWVGKRFIDENPEKWEKRAKERDGQIHGGYIMYRIGGHLDMLFWNMIHIGHEIWDKALKYTYVKYQHSKEKENVN